MTYLQWLSVCHSRCVMRCGWPRHRHNYSGSGGKEILPIQKKPVKAMGITVSVKTLGITVSVKTRASQNPNCFLANYGLVFHSFIFGLLCTLVGQFGWCCIVETWTLWQTLYRLSHSDSSCMYANTYSRSNNNRDDEGLKNYTPSTNATESQLRELAC